MDMSWRTSRVFDQDVWLRSGLAFWNVFAEHALVAFDPPFPVGAILKPLGDTRLGMNLAIHHGDAGLITVGDDLFQADLAVAQKCDEGNEHGVSVRRKSGGLCHAAFVPNGGRTKLPSRTGTEACPFSERRPRPQKEQARPSVRAREEAGIKTRAYFPANQER